MNEWMVVFCDPECYLLDSVGTACLSKKYGVVDYWYFMNGNTLQCNIIRQDKYNIHLVVCEVSTPNVKYN